MPPFLRERALGLGGLGETGLPANALGQNWRDCDRAMVVGGPTPETTGVRAWPGNQRVGMKLRKRQLSSVDLFGSAAKVDQFGYSRKGIQIVRVPESYIRKTRGHGLAALDAETNTENRGLGIAYQPEGVLGSKGIGQVVKVVGTDDGYDYPKITGSYTGTDWKIYRIKISNVLSTFNQFKYSSDDGSTYSSDTTFKPGARVDIGNGLFVTFGRRTGHTLNDVWRFIVGNRPQPVARLNRVGPHDYVNMIHGHRETLIFNQWDRVLADDGQNVGLAGIPAPYIRPTVAATITEPDQTDLADTENATLQWTAVAPAFVRGPLTSQPQSTQSTIFPADQSRFFNIGIGVRHLGGNRVLAYRNMPAPATIAAVTKRIRWWLFVEHLAAPIPPGGISIVFYSDASMGGTSVVLSNDAPIDGYERWVNLDLPWRFNGAFTFNSIAIMKSGEWTNSDGPVNDNFDIYIDKIWQDQTDDSTLFTDKGNWYFRHTWLNRKTLRQSAPSPWYGPIKLNSTAVTLDLSGGYPGIQAGLRNTMPEGADAAMVYVGNDTWDVDPRLGGLPFYLLSPDNGNSAKSLNQIAVASNPAAGGGNTGNGSCSPVSMLSSEVVDETWTLTATSATNFTVVGSVSGSQSALTVGSFYSNGLFQTSIVAGTVAFIAGDVFTFSVTHQDTSATEIAQTRTGDGTISNVLVSANASWERVTLTATSATNFTVVGSLSGSHAAATVGTAYSVTDFMSFLISAGGTPFVAGDKFVFDINPGSLKVTFSNNTRLEDIIAGSGNLVSAPGRPRHPFFNSLPRPGKIGVVDGNLICTMGRDEYSVGKWARTQGSNIITPIDSGSAASTPVVGEWMEGRSIRFEDDVETYDIVKALDTNHDGILDALYIGHGYDADRQVYREGYLGETSSGGVKGIILADDRHFNWTNVTEQYGVDVKTMSLLNRAEGVPGGDRIIGGFKVDEFLWTVGAKSARVWRQNPGVLADQPIATGAAYVNPTDIDGVGILSPRAVVPLSDQTAVGVGSKGEIYVFTANQVTRHPASAVLENFLNGRGLLVDTVNLRHSWVQVIRTADSDYLNLYLIRGSGATDSTGPGVIANEEDEYAFTSSGSAPNMTAGNPFTFAGTGTEYGASYDTAALGGDFEYCVKVDLKRGLVFLGSECRFSAGMVEPAFGDAAQGQLPGGTFVLDTDGYIRLADDPKLLTWGNPKTRFVLEATATGAVGGVTIGTTQFPASQLLAVDADGDSMLPGLIMAKVSTDGTIEYRRISSVSGAAITNTAIWTALAVATDKILVAPLPWMIQWAELRGRYPLALRDFTVDLDETETSDSTGATTISFDPVLKLEIFAASGARPKADYSAAAVTKLMRLSDLEAAHGWLDLEQRSRKALCYRLSVLGGQQGRIVARNFMVRERVQNGKETGR